MNKMNNKKWKEVLKKIVGKTFRCNEFGEDLICMCDTENNIYLGDFEKRAWKETEFVGVYEENSDNYILLEVVRDDNNEKIEVIDGWVKFK